MGRQLFKLVELVLLVYAVALSDAESISITKAGVWLEPGSFEVKVKLSTESENSVAGLWVLSFRGPKGDREIVYQGVRRLGQQWQSLTYTTRVSVQENYRRLQSEDNKFLLCVWLFDGSQFLYSETLFADLDYIWPRVTAAKCYPLRDPFSEPAGPLLSRRQWLSYRSRDWQGQLREHNLLRQVCKNHQGHIVLLDGPVAFSDDNVGLLNFLQSPPALGYWPLSATDADRPRFSLSFLVFLHENCHHSFCSLLHHTLSTSPMVGTPSIFLLPGGKVLYQVSGVLAGDHTTVQAQGAISPATMVHVGVWTHISLRMIGSWFKLCSSQLVSDTWPAPVCFQHRFDLVVTFNESDGVWVLSGSAFHHGTHAVFSEVAYYRNIASYDQQVPLLISDELSTWPGAFLNSLNCSRLSGQLRVLHLLLDNRSTHIDLEVETVEDDGVCHVPLQRSWQDAAGRPFQCSSLSEAAAWHTLQSLLPPRLMNVTAEHLQTTLKELAMELMVQATPDSRHILHVLLALGCLGDAEAYFLLGALHSAGVGLKQNHSLALDFWLLAASKGNILSQLALGAHLVGNGSQLAGVQCSKALAYYQSAATTVIAEWQNPTSGSGVFTEYLRLSEPESLEGQSGEDDEVVQFLRYMADRGDAAAQDDLGRLHYWGQQGIARDHDMAYHYYNQAASAGHANGMFNAAIMHLKNQTENASNERAVELLEKAADKGHAAALNGLGYHYLNVINNASRAVSYFQRAADMGSHDGLYNIGSMWLAGLVPNNSANTSRAAKYWREAAEGGHVEAIAGLAGLLALGQGVDRSCTEAVRLYRSVAETSSSVGTLLRQAVSAYLAIERRKALLYYVLLAESGIEVAQFNAAWLCEQFPEEKFSEDCRWRYYSMSAENNFTEALVLVANDLWYGHSRPVDWQRSLQLYALASDLGDSQGLFNLAWIVASGSSLFDTRFGDSFLSGQEGNLTLSLNLLGYCVNSSNTDGHVPCGMAAVYIQNLPWIQTLPSLMQAKYVVPVTVLLALVCSCLPRLICFLDT